MSVEEQVFRFQVAVYDILFVQVFEGKSHFGGVEFGDWIGEALGEGVSTAILSPYYTQSKVRPSTPARKVEASWM